MPWWREYDVTSWSDRGGGGTPGTRAKTWLEDTDGKLYLVKTPKYEAELAIELIGLQLGKMLQISTARGFPCWHKGEMKLASHDFNPNRDLAASGNEILGAVGEYTPKIKANYTLDRIRKAIVSYCDNPCSSRSVLESFAEMLYLDALLGIQDRHGQNWEVISMDPKRLAPVYDLASCLAFRQPPETLQNERALRKFRSGCRSRFGDGENERVCYPKLLNILDTNWPEWATCQSKLRPRLEALDFNFIEEVPHKWLVVEKKQVARRLLEMRREWLLTE